ncbi:MAG: metallopeptidase TldD-related protein [Treponema sp.]
MKEKIIKLLKENRDLSAYSIVFSNTVSKEVFFVKDKLDMNRGKEVFHVLLTVYKDFELEGKKYRGSASCKISPQDDEAVICQKITDSVFAAGFVKNDWYPLPKAINGTCSEGKQLQAKALLDSIVKMKNCVYAKNETQANINSVEFFASSSFIEVINSEGVDVCFIENKNETEVITDAKGTEEVEIYGYEAYGDINEASLKETVEEQLKNTQERAIAKKAEHIDSINVILRGSAVSSFFGFYTTQASSINVYTGQSRAKIGENFQGEVKGDSISISLEPNMENAVHAASYDTEGNYLKRTVLYDAGVVSTYHGNLRYAHYLGIEATGTIANTEVKAGTLSYQQDMKAKPYVEILMFSDFFMDATTGNFGGEFRLARYFDGKEVHIITGGSISGNMFKVQSEMYFSKELMSKDSYKGPKAVFLPNMEIVG